MKKLVLFIAVIGLTFQAFAGEPAFKKKKNLFAKNDDGEKCFDENTHVINVGVGWGRHYYSFINAPGFSSGTTPAFSITYEQPWKQKLGPGYLGVGAYLGFQHAYYKYNDAYYVGFNYNTYYYNHSWNYYMVAARAAYHWDVLNTKNAELYAGVLIGMRFQTDNYTTNDPNNRDPYSYKQSFIYPTYSVFAGARWYFAKNFGLFGEVGYGISYITGGVSIKF